MLARATEHNHRTQANHARKLDLSILPQRLTMKPEFNKTFVTVRSMAACVYCSPQFLRKVVREQGLRPDVFLVSERRCCERSIPLFCRTRFDEIQTAVMQAKAKRTRRN